MTDSFWKSGYGALVIGTLLVLALSLGFISYASNKAAEKHRVELEMHGCKKQAEMPTGKRIYCGKACSREEMLTLYECAGGSRVEIDGKWAGGVK